MVNQRIHVAFLLFQSVVATLIHYGKSQIKAAEHFHQPLMGEGIRYHDQGTLCPASVQLIVEDQPRLDGFAKTDLICQKNPWRMAPGNFMGNVYLVWQMLRAGADQPLG